MMQYGFELSEREKLPVLMRIVMRLAHSRAAVTVKEEAEEVRGRCPVRDPASWVLLPCQFAPEICRIGGTATASGTGCGRSSLHALNRLRGETGGHIGLQYRI